VPAVASGETDMSVDRFVRELGVWRVTRVAWRGAAKVQTQAAARRCFW
jgi:hypothetical protein